MGKIVKYCSSCDESFAEKFGFCPTCGASLQPFEMNPVAVEPVVEKAPPAPEFIEEAAPEPVTAQVFSMPEPVVEAAPEVIEEIDEPTVETQPAITAAAPVFVQTTPVDIDRKPVASSAPVDTFSGYDGFHVTVVEDTGAGKRMSLLAGTLVVMVFMLMSGLVYNIFSKDLGIGSIDEGVFNAVLLDDPDSMTIEEEEKKKNDKDGGGGGGGGKDEETPASQGVRPPMLRQPQFIPTAHAERLTDPDIRIQRAIQGPVDETTMDPNQRYGIDTSKYNTISDGPGTGGGIGTGRGTGVGSGNGTGAGSGNGSGLGGGNGNGIGDGDGDGTGGTRRPPPVAVGVTQALRIISKPKATYTDAARQNQVQGNVTLRITFNANGSIGSITPVSGLGYGLTEQAIAAARRIQFEPAKVNGVPQTVSKTFQYGFTIY
ncbi:MAG: TonB family protein [Acidobacteria bacterium]|nr:TonB family protein [Acidobacteriota bacterium]